MNAKHIVEITVDRFWTQQLATVVQRPKLPPCRRCFKKYCVLPPALLRGCECGPLWLVELWQHKLPEVSESSGRSALTSSGPPLDLSAVCGDLEGKIEYHQPRCGQSSSHRWYRVVSVRLAESCVGSSIDPFPWHTRLLEAFMAGSFLKESKRDSKGDMPGGFLGWETQHDPLLNCQDKNNGRGHVRGRGYFAPEPASRTRPWRI